MPHTDHATTTNESIAFPLLPQILPTVLRRAEVLEKWPAFFDILDELVEFVRNEKKGLVGLVASRHILSGIPAYMGFGAALVVPLPEVLEPSLVELAAQQPAVYNQTSIDLMENETVLEWQAELDNAERWSLLVPESEILDFVNACRGGGIATAVWLPVVFLAGDTVVCGGFWFDAELEVQMQGASIGSGGNYKPHRAFDDEQLADAAESARRAGSPTPWKDGVWKDGDGVHMAWVNIFKLNEPGNCTDGRPL